MGVSVLLNGNRVPLMTIRLVAELFHPFHAEIYCLIVAPLHLNARNVVEVQ